VIGEIGPGDAPVVAALDQAVFGGNAWSEDAWRQEIRAVSAADRRYFVFRASGAILGYAGILRAGSDADVLTVAVVDDARRQGIGRQLVEELLGVAREWRCQAIYLEVEHANAAAIAMYESLGFRATGTRRHYYGPGRHAVTMRCQVREPWGSLPVGTGDG